MPKPTFFNLPVEKRSRVLRAALTEFATQPFDQASLSAIIKASGISKGSLYQYFHGKVDLWRYLVGEALQRRQAWVDGKGAPANLDATTALQHRLAARLEWLAVEPAWGRVLRRLRDEMRDPAAQAHAVAVQQTQRAPLSQWLKGRVPANGSALRPDAQLRAAMLLVEIGAEQAFLDEVTPDTPPMDRQALARRAVREAFQVLLCGIVESAATPPPSAVA